MREHAGDIVMYTLLLTGILGLIAGSNPASFVFEDAPLSSALSVGIVVPVYLATLAGLKQWVYERGTPFNLRSWLVAHNAGLSIVSAALLTGLVAEVGDAWSRRGFWAVFCDPDRHFGMGRLMWLCYINYLLKYVELLDTVQLALRGKPTTFLHVYHHAITLVLCWTQLAARSCVQWVVIGLNLTVHVWMYAFYALHAMHGAAFVAPCKAALTATQIAQFVADLVVCVVAFMHGLLPADRPCSGEVPAALFGIAVLASYLLLFLHMALAPSIRHRP